MTRANNRSAKHATTTSSTGIDLDDFERIVDTALRRKLPPIVHAPNIDRIGIYESHGLNRKREISTRHFYIATAGVIFTLFGVVTSMLIALHLF